MIEDENQKLIDEIVLLSKLSNHRLREQTLKLIDIYYLEKKKHNKDKARQKNLLKHLDKRDLAIQKSREKQDKLLQQQSKMASMGEMMDAVAHQWKQPLNSISMMNDMLLDDFKESIVDETYIKDMTQTIQHQIEHMVSTLNEFRTFFRPSKDLKDFSLQICLKSVQVLMKDELLKNQINIKTETEEDISIFGEINEFKHLFLNLINNSIDAFNEKKIQKREIYITAKSENEDTIIRYEDNAGGIPQEILGDILKPNVTTKEEGKGTGIGLYMSSQIVQKHQGTLEVANSDVGAVFTIKL